jgi:hypothetical protein
MPDKIQETFKERNSEAMISFGYRLKNQFSINEAYRRPKELEWIESLRQYKGLYDPSVKIEANNSKVYPKITRSKINIALSRLHEMLFPETDKNWELEPTPEPKIPKETVKQIAISLVTEDPETGEPILPSIDDLRLAIKKYCDETCGRMSTVIDDQLTEMDYPEETKKVLRSGLMYGTGIMKGPLVNYRTKRRWEPTEGGDYEEITESEDVPDLKAIRIWDFYPDMSVTEANKAEGFFERHLVTKHDLRKLAKRSDFYSDMIYKHLEENPNGDYVPRNWETDLQVIDIEAGTGKSERISTPFTDDASKSSSRQMGRKYELLEYWGYVDGQDLEACGVQVDDVKLEYAANVFILGSKPVKAILYEGALDQYKLFYYEKDETSIFGEGLARIMRHPQLSVAAAARMVLDNGACVSGPQVEVNWSLMAPGQDLNSFYPRKIWWREGKGIDAQYPAIRSLDFESHIDELINIIELFKNFGDEETTLPTWMIGQMVNNETAQATSGRLSTITISIKDVVKNFDSFTEKILRDMYAWNMDFNPRTDIKGDFKAKARGVSSLVMKEIRMQALTQLAAGMSPDDWVYIDRREFLKERFKAHDVNISLKTEEEAQKIRDAMENSRIKQLTYAQIESEIEKNRAQALSQTTKAKKVNVEATKDAQTPPEIPEGADPRLTEEEIALQQTKRMGEQAKIRREEEKHAQDLTHKGEDHIVKKAIETSKAAHDMTVKEKTASHGMKMKEKMATVKAKQPKKKKENA